MALVAYALAALIGLSLGLLGGGGSILTVPVFVYVLGFDPKLAIAMSLPVVGITSLIGTVSHWRAGNVNLRMAGLFGVIAMGGAYAGARLSVFLTADVQLALLAVVMLAAAASMLRSARPGAGAPPADAALGERAMAVGLLAPVALGVGVLTGLVGIGGGFLVVPALVLLGRVSMAQAVGTSLLVIAMNSLSGFAGYLGGAPMPWGFMAGFTAVAAAGIVAGSRLVRFIAPRTLKQGFAAFLLVMGAFILYKNRHAFDAPPRASTTANLSDQRSVHAAQAIL